MTMNYGIAVLTFLFIASLSATVLAASSVNVNIQNNVNTNQKTTTSTNSNVSSSNNAKVTNHIEIEVNGQKKVIDDTREGSDVNSNIKVEAKSENGETTFNIEGNPQSVKSSTATDSKIKGKESTTSSSTPVDKDVEIKKEDFFAKIVSFFTHLFSSLKFWK